MSSTAYCVQRSGVCQGYTLRDPLYRWSVVKCTLKLVVNGKMPLLLFVSGECSLILQVSSKLPLHWWSVISVHFHLQLLISASFHLLLMESALFHCQPMIGSPVLGHNNRCPLSFVAGVKYHFLLADIRKCFF